MGSNCIILPKADKFKCRINGKTSTSPGQRLGLSSLDMIEINKRYKCTVNGGWGGWSGWSKCSKKCVANNMGVKSRKRKCDSPKPNNGGLQCTGPATGTAECLRQKGCACKDTKKRFCFRNSARCGNSWIKQRCPLTCRTCCGNVWTDRACRKQQKKRKCWKKNVRKNCRKTCKAGKDCK